VDTPRRARFWEELGADVIVLESFSINRNFRRLAAIRQSVHCELQLIANHVCLLNCPLQTYHQNGFAHASDDTSTLFIDCPVDASENLRLTERLGALVVTTAPEPVLMSAALNADGST
jgi:collagenase-like PrtC family protease